MFAIDDDCSAIVGNLTSSSPRSEREKEKGGEQYL